MKLAFRWYGEGDSIPVRYLRQIPNMSGVVTACYDVPVGEVWNIETLQKLKGIANGVGLAMEVIESIPVAEDIKLGKPTRDRLIENYCENLFFRTELSPFSHKKCSLLSSLAFYHFVYLPGREQFHMNKI